MRVPAVERAPGAAHVFQRSARYSVYFTKNVERRMRRWKRFKWVRMHGCDSDAASKIIFGPGDDE